MTAQAAGTTTFDVAAVSLGTAATTLTITGSDGEDIIATNGARSNYATTVNAGGGVDTIYTGSKNDTIDGGAGNDVIDSGAGVDSVDGGAGNDRVIISADANLSATDSYAGGAGTDIIEFTADMTDAASTLQTISGFETLRMNSGAADTLTYSNFINNQGFTQIQYGNSATGRFTNTNVADSVTTIQLGTNAVSITGDSVTMDRLVDGSANTLTVKHDSGGNAATVASLIIDDEETVTLTTDTADDNLIITALDSADLTTLNMTGKGDITITAFTAVTDMPTTVDASAMTGAASVTLANGLAAATMTGGSGQDVFVGTKLADTITGGGGADNLTGGAGNDTINGGAAGDTLTGSAGADTITTGTGSDTVNAGATVSVAATAWNFAAATVAAGDTITFGNGVDVITDFTAGATASGGDILNVTTAAESTLIGETVADLTAGSETFIASGTWDAASKTFTILAAGSGADTMVVEAVNGGVNDALTTATSVQILLSVDTDDIVAANIA